MPDEDDIPEARVISEEPEEEEKPKYDPRSDFMRGFAEGRESEQVQKPHVLQQRIDALERIVADLRKRIEELEQRVR